MSPSARRVALVAVAVAFAGTPTGPAEAHWLATGWHFTDPACVRGYGEVSHSPAHMGGRFTSAVESWRDWSVPGVGSGSCVRRYDRHARVWHWVYAWPHGASEWSLCLATPPAGSGGPVFRYRITVTFSGASPCGPAYYTITALGEKWAGNRWAGGAVALRDWSPIWYHWLPEGTVPPSGGGGGGCVQACPTDPPGTIHDPGHLHVDGRRLLR